MNLVSQSFAFVRPIEEQVAALFYSRLFELNPSLRPLFRPDLKEQGRKLMSTVGAAVAAVKNMTSLQPALEALAQRHVKYGVKSEHFEEVGAALMWTFEQSMGPKFSP